MRKFLAIALLTTCCARVAHTQLAPATISPNYPAATIQDGSSHLSTEHSLFDASDSQPLVSEPSNFAKLMMPSFNVAAEWQAEASDVELTSYDARMTIPTYPVFGPPPPFLNAGFSYFDIDAPAALDLPAEL